MFRHNIIITIRKFQRNKTSFLINLIGLSTGLACALLIYLWIGDEMGIDKFHEKDSQLYQVMYNHGIGGEVRTSLRTPSPLAKALRDEMPEVEYAISINDFFNWQGKKGLLSIGEKHIEVKGLHAEKDFFHVFSYPLIEGNKDQVLKDKNSIILSKSLAENLFGSTENVVGQTLDWKHVGYNGSYQVSGIFEDAPANSTYQFDVVFHMEQLLDNDRWAKNWTGGYAQTFLILNKDADLNEFNNKIKNLPGSKNPILEKTSLCAIPFSSRYLHGEFENGVQTGEGRVAYVRLFALIALFLLLIACVNFMNLSTAEASRKMKEIGVKKTIGASRKTLIFQLLSESLILSGLSLILALVLISLLLPQFNELTGKELTLNFSLNAVLTILGIMFFTGFVAGSYPAFYLSGFKPISVLQGKLHSFFGEVWIRKGLVVFQFSLSIIFIVGLLVIHQQIEYTQNKEMGYDRENILTFQWKGELYDNWSGLGEEGKSNDKYYSFKEGLRNIPGVISASSLMHGNVLDNIVMQSGITWDGDESNRNFSFKSPVVGYDFIETLGIELSAGRTFSRAHNDDYHKIVLNEAAVRMMGIEDPVGKKLGLNGGSDIIGVVKDFHYGSLYNSIEPLIFRFDINGGNLLTKIEAGNEQATIKRLQTYYEKLLPGQRFEFSFLDTDYQRQYESETRVAILSKYFAGLAILISCLGLFGLAMFTAERRKKEIGIRKVLGASVFGVVQMLSRDFTKIVLTAILISIPISYLLVQNWLNGFAFSVDLQWWYFLIPAVLVLVIAWAIVGMQTFHAARVNPVESLQAD